MDNFDILERIDELERDIAALPQGSISAKRVRGKEYYYHRITRNKKRTETYVDFDKIDELRSMIEKRKNLEAKVKELKKQISPSEPSQTKRNKYKFNTYVRINEQLRAYASQVKNFKKRDCFEQLSDYVFGEHQDKVFILCGLRRTGKTTLIRQVISEMTPEQQSMSAFIQIKTNDTLSDVNSDLQYLESLGFRYVFIDEVTLMEDFIEGAALFSDIYASSGMKIVLSGTDSLGFVFCEYEQLYDRCLMQHTTFIPYREFERVLGINGIDEFIRYGGTMSLGGKNYNERSSFATKKSADDYIDSAIARNIQHSLEYYQDGDHFRSLYDLYRNNELTSAINRVVEDMNHRFTKEILTRTFRSSTLSSSAKNLIRDSSFSFDLLKNIDENLVLSSVKTMLDIIEKEEQTVEVDDAHAYQIKEYLALLDLIMEIDRIHFPNVNNREKIVVISQPGLRYAQAKALVDALLLDERFNKISIIDRERVLERVMSTVKGRMLEEIVLLETKLAFPKKEVFQLQFAIGEFDMVVHDPDTLTCKLFEIKYNENAYPEQYVHLANEEKCAETEYRFGKITGKYVIYRGKNQEINDIKYLNVEDYLKSLG